MKLYETYAELEALWAKVADVISGDVTEGPDGLPVTQDDALNWLEEALSRIEGERDRKALNIACFVKNLRAEAEALKAEKQRLAKRQQAAERTVERLVGYLEQFVEPGTKLKDARATIGWRKSEGVSVTCPVESLPEGCRRVKVEADLTAIKAALQAGELILGAVLETRNHIQIR